MQFPSPSFACAFASAQSNGSRTVKYAQSDIVEIHAKLRFSTLIVLPSDEDILDFTTGDKDYWIINGSHNLCYLHPAAANIQSDLNLVTTRGHIYSFLLTEISKRPSEEPDLKVFVEPKDSSRLGSVTDPPAGGGDRRHPGRHCEFYDSIEEPYGNRNADFQLHQPTSSSERRAVRLHRPSHVHGVRHHHDRLVWSQIRPHRRRGGGRFHFGKFAEFLLLIAFGYAMINYYNSPIPGFGASFPQLVTNQLKYLTTLIGDTALQKAQTAITSYSQTIPSPSLANISATYEYVVVEIILAVWKFVSIAVNLLGPVATAVAVLLGPLFIPFFIVPSLEFLFWGWLKFFLAYSFYSVVAAAVTFVMCNVVVYALQFPPFFPLPLDYTSMIGESPFCCWAVPTSCSKSRP